MSFKRRFDFARGLVAVAMATVMVFSALPSADASIMIFHNDKAPYHLIPGDTIQAEDWFRAADIANEAATDLDGDEAVGSIHDGDWTEYFIGVGSSLDETYTYNVEARVASATNGGTITMTVDGVDVGAFQVGGTGGWQNWTTVGTTVTLQGGAETLRLTFNGSGQDQLLNLNWIDFSYPPEQHDTVRSEAVDQMVRALESFAAREGTFDVAGGGFDGNGQGWAFYEGGRYATSIASVLIDGSHLSERPQHDPLWTDQGSTVGDVLVYRCRGRVGVFTLEGSGAPSAEDRAWWDTNNCNPYPIERLGATYFALSGAASSDSELQRRDAVHAFVSALEHYGTDHDTYVVDGAGWDGNGQGWAFYEGGRHPKSIANALIDGGYMAAEPLLDPLWTTHTSIAGDVLVYSCRDRVAVFTREGDLQPSANDRDWWDTNGCNRYPIDRLGVSYFALSAPL